MGIMDLSHKYRTLEELIFQVDITEIGRGFIEAQEEKHNVFFFFFPYCKSPIFILIQQFT